MPKPQLRIVDAAGELHDIETCPNCTAKEGEFVELQRKMRGLARELGELRRDKDAEARAHEAWPILMRLFDYWREQTGHERARWESSRFWEALPLLKAFGMSNVAAGIAGIGYDANRKEQKNGKFEVYDSWELLFRNAGTLERYIKRRPAGWECPAEFNEDTERKRQRDARKAATAPRG